MLWFFMSQATWHGVLDIEASPCVKCVAVNKTLYGPPGMACLS